MVVALSADMTVEEFDVTKTMCLCQVVLQNTFRRKLLGTDVTLKSWYVTDAVNSFDVKPHAAGLCKLPAANLAWISRVRMLRS